MGLDSHAMSLHVLYLYVLCTYVRTNGDIQRLSSTRSAWVAPNACAAAEGVCLRLHLPDGPPSPAIRGRGLACRHRSACVEETDCRCAAPVEQKQAACMSPKLARPDWARDTKTDRTQDVCQQMTLAICTCAVERERAVTSIRARTPRRH